MGVTKKIGWHSFRHGFSNLLRENGVDVKVAQRHANSRITLDIYQRTVTDERRAAQELVFKDLLGERNLEARKHPKPARTEEVLPGSGWFLRHDWIRTNDLFRVKYSTKCNPLILKRTDGSESAQNDPF